MNIRVSKCYYIEQKIKDDAIKYDMRLTIGYIRFIKIRDPKKINLE